MKTDIDKRIEEAARAHLEPKRISFGIDAARAEGFTEGAKWALEYVKEATDFYEAEFGLDILKGESYLKS